jgi:hypothetical protein
MHVLKLSIKTMRFVQSVDTAPQILNLEMRYM